MKKQSFITGAAILMIANAISKILGAVFKIPLTYILHEDGMAIFGVAFQAYIMILTFIISGFPIAVSKTVSEKNACGDFKTAHNTVGTASVILCVTGLIGTAVLYFGAEFFAFAMKEEKAVFAIKCIAPSVFFVAAGTACKSYYQGSSDMIPTAVSQVTEALVKLAVGYFLAVYFIGGGTYKSAGGATAGVTAGEFIASFMLITMYFHNRRGINAAYEHGERRKIIKNITAVALPILAAAVISNAMSLAETAVIRTQLLKAGLSAEKARYLYGAYTGYAMTVFNLPSGILATLGVSILPVISGAAAAGDYERASRTARSGIGLTIFLAVPCAVIMYLLPSEILEVLFHNTASADMLKAAAPCIVFLCVTQITSSVMQATGKIYESVVFMFSGLFLKLILSAVLIAKPEINIYGAVIASNVCCFVTAIINSAAVHRFLKVKYGFVDFILKPFAAGTVMFCIIGILKEKLAGFLPIIGLTCMCFAGGTAYLFILWLTGAIKKRGNKKLL